MANITHSRILALSSGASNQSQLTKGVVLILSSISQPMYFTKSDVLILSSPSDCITKLCQCWKITRSDGITFSYTTHSKPVTFLGTTFGVCRSINSSAFESGVINRNGVGDIEINGIMGDDGISEHDVVNGLFDNATVEGYIVSWDTANQTNSKRILKGIIGSTKHSKTSYTFEILTVGLKLNQRPLLDVYTPSCRYELGVSPCPVNILDYDFNGSVTGIVSRSGINKSSYRQFFDTSTSHSDGYYDLGVLTWTSGLNDGISSEIKSYRQSDGLITLWSSMPNEIEIGDTYNMYPGCTKLMETHTTRFGLTEDSFGGFPDIPGNDALVRTPDGQ